MPSNYERYQTKHPVHGDNSIVLQIPPRLPDRCITVTTVDPNGGASVPEEACL